MRSSNVDILTNLSAYPGNKGYLGVPNELGISSPAPRFPQIRLEVPSYTRLGRYAREKAQVTTALGAEMMCGNLVALEMVAQGKKPTPERNR